MSLQSIAGKNKSGVYECKNVRIKVGVVIKNFDYCSCSEVSEIVSPGVCYKNADSDISSHLMS